LFERGGYLVFERKRQVSKLTFGPTSECDLRYQNVRWEKGSGLERKSGRRSKKFKSDRWYEKAALSMAIGGKRD
jgi:hypothetical protein